MKILGFNFDKISIEKLSNKVENLKVNTKIDISEIKEVKSDFLKTKEEIVNIKFSYDINYDPNFAKINLAGNIILSINPKVLKEVLKQWKDKKMPEEFRISVFNIILRKSNLKALQLEEEMNLPLHIPMPSIKRPEKKE